MNQFPRFLKYTLNRRKLNKSDKWLLQKKSQFTSTMCGACMNECEWISCTCMKMYYALCVFVWMYECVWVSFRGFWVKIRIKMSHVLTHIKKTTCGKKESQNECMWALVTECMHLFACEYTERNSHMKIGYRKVVLDW